MWKKQVLQDPGYVDTVEACCMLHTMQGAILIVFTVYVDTTSFELKLQITAALN